MKTTLFYAIAGVMLISASASTFAENKWANYQGVDTSKPQHRPPSMNRPGYPQYPQSGISIQYNAPTTITQNSQSYSWVIGDPASASISSSTYTFISDWKRIGLPAPPSGMYWIFENGRYVLVPNR